MSVSEYALDVNKTVNEIIKMCENLGFNIKNPDDMLDEEMIIELDNSLANYDEIDEEIEEIEVVVSNQKVDHDNVVSKQKLKKKADSANTKTKKDLANKKKAMYKNKEKLISNAPVSNENVVLYKENMTIAELATALNVPSSELIKKLFMLGVMATVNTSITFENAEILVLDYNK